ncbi:hypothetical protein OG271_03310 [Micromonospora rifamycinica]|uniref:hypothetical protein n=1 Tax=Micromonospora rifamycinica TaxID=291594 RepID=UPI002E2A5A20|nr:hypothetical protein [Micromonospora rifamycinica]
MTVSVIMGLLIQAAALAGVHLAIRGEWLRRPAALMLVVAVAFHGVTEVVQLAWPGRNFFRGYFGDQSAFDDWVLLVSGGIACYAAAYALIVVPSRCVKAPAHAASEPGLAGVPLPWLLALLLPLLVATWQGRGALQPLSPLAAEESPEAQGLMVGLANGLVVPLIAITAVVVLVRWGMRWLLPVLVVQALVLITAGTRSMIVFAAVLTLVGAAVHGLRPSRRQVAALTVLVAVSIAVISSTRAVAGREVFNADQGGTGRVEALIDGAAALREPGTRDVLLDDVVYRFDGNTFGAQVFVSLRGVGQPTGLVTVGNDLAMLVPSAITPDKIANRSLEQRSEEAYLARTHGLSQYVDWLPTILGTAIGYYGPVGMLLVALLFGAIMGAADRWVLRSLSTARAALAVGLAQGALLYGAGPQSVLTSLRETVTLTVLLASLAWLHRRRTTAVSVPVGGPVTVRQRPGHQADQGWRDLTSFSRSDLPVSTRSS